MKKVRLGGLYEGDWLSKGAGMGSPDNRRKKCTISRGAALPFVWGMRCRYGPEHASKKCEFLKCGSVEAWTTGQLQLVYDFLEKVEQLK